MNAKRIQRLQERRRRVLARLLNAREALTEIDRELVELTVETTSTEQVPMYERFAVLFSCTPGRARRWYAKQIYGSVNDTNVERVRNLQRYAKRVGLLS